MPAVPTSPLKAKPVEPKRRFTDKPDLDPSAVWSLPPTHQALTENRTLFPSTVVDVDDNFEDRLLVSGENNRKLGKSVIKGKFKGYALHGLSLEERATCSPKCSARAYCYGNGMQMARRHRITDMELFSYLIEDEIREVLETEPGLLVRLHVLGDFPSAEYVALWADLLDSHPALACYGYTHWTAKDEIGAAIHSVKQRFPDRFRIRWSGDLAAPDSVIVVSEIPTGPRFKGALVCPAQTDATACCASCGMCWEGATKKETIAFIKHGKRSLDVAASSVEASPVRDRARKIAPVQLPSSCIPSPLHDVAPVLRMAEPKSLLVESSYQRDLSGKSIQLIRKIVSGWDWAKFKPPICAETSEGLFVIDGQHTAIAAASHPSIKSIPVMVTTAHSEDRRAASFVSHNRDRLMMTPAQIFYGELAAKDKTARAIMECVVKAGASIPRVAPGKGYWKPGQVAAVGELRAAISNIGPSGLERILRIAVMSKACPIGKTLLRGLRELADDKHPDAKIAEAVASIKDLDSAARLRGLENGVSAYMGCAELIAEALQ